MRCPALERGNPGEAALGEEAKQLELGVDPRLEPAVELQHETLVEDDRRVRLLDSHRPRVAELRLRDAVDGAELEQRLLAPERLAGADEAHELPGELGIVHRVVGDPVAGLGDRLAPLLGLRPEPERHLVDLVRPGREADLDEREHERGRGLASRGRLEHARPRHLARLRAEPAPARHVRDEALLVDLLNEPNELAHSAPLSWNQKYPRGARVSR